MGVQIYLLDRRTVTLIVGTYSQKIGTLSRSWKVTEIDGDRAAEIEAAKTNISGEGAPVAVKGSMEQRIGRRATVFVVPLRSIPAWRIFSPKKQLEWRRFVQTLEEHNVEVQFVSRDVENAA